MSGSCDASTRLPSGQGASGRGAAAGTASAAALQPSMSPSGTEEQPRPFPAHQRRLPAEDAQKPCGDRVVCLIDLDRHQSQQRVAWRLYVDPQHLLGVAAGKKTFEQTIFAA